MPAPTDLPTYRDILDYLIDYQRGNPSAYVQRNARRAIVEALRVLTNSHSWANFSQFGRVNTVAPYATGTITYDHTAGAYERQVTLVDGIWPEWAAYGTLVIGTVPYSVSERRSDLILQLDVHENLGADLTDPTPYCLYRDTYTLPVDCATVDQIYSPNSSTCVQYAHPREWLRAHRYNEASSGSPSIYTVTGDPDFQGQLAIRLYPYPDLADNLDFMYQRRPRSNSVEGSYTGTVTVSAGGSTVVGTGTAWDDTLVGSLIRFSGTTNELPSGLDGGNPYRLERMIMEVTDDHTLMIDQPATWALAGVKYVISDPIDIEPGVMQTVFLRCCESQLGKIARFPDRDKLEIEYLIELERAKSADSRSTAPRSGGSQAWNHRRMADMPQGADVE